MLLLPVHVATNTDVILQLLPQTDPANSSALSIIIIVLVVVVVVVKIIIVIVDTEHVLYTLSMLNFTVGRGFKQH